MKIRTFSEYCKELFGTKVYRISLSTGCGCPNRDGKVGYGGCTFCSEKGSGDFGSFDREIEVQIKKAKELVNGKFPQSIEEEDRRYIAYFQSFTNTYGDTRKLRDIFETVVKKEEIVAISIGTRPDCLEEDKIRMLSELNKQKPVWVELGLQTIKEECAKKINRCYSLDVFESAYQRLKAHNLEVIVHVILGFPYETKEEMLDTVRYLSRLHPRIDGIKLHLLHILEGTKLAKEYQEEKFSVMSLEEYVVLIIDCLKILPEETVIHRMTGDGDKKILIEPKWSGDKKRVLNTLNRAIREAKRENETNKNDFT